jgi:hypothetical protein
MAAAEQQPPEDGRPKFGVALGKLTSEARHSLTYRRICKAWS